MSWQHLVLIVVSTLTLTGCDPTRTIRQTVTVRVESHEADRSIVGLEVGIREVRERTEENARFYDYDPEYRIASRWFYGVVKTDGTAEVTVFEEALDADKNSSPTHREAVRGHVFQLELKEGKNVLQSHKATFGQGLVVDGSLFTVSILSISAPQYVSLDDEIK